MEIIFNVNKLGLEGLCATLTSLLRNCSNRSILNLYFLYDGLVDDDRLMIKHIVEEEGGCNIHFIEFNAKKEFGHLRPLHGDWTPYGRLLIPQLIKSSYALYLDSDLIINLDILELSHFDLYDNLVGAVHGGQVKYAYDNIFFINKLGWDENTQYFNSGVLLINIDKWNKEKYTEKWKQFAERYPNELLLVDQTILNFLCKGKFAELPLKYNVPWYCNSPAPQNVQNAILHFVGSPKPWDLFGSFFHQGYDIFSHYTSDDWKRIYLNWSLGKIKRSWKIRRSVIRHFYKKIANR